MTLDERTMRLIAVGASITANCQPCLQANAVQALQEGITEQDIAGAIEIGAKVRGCTIAGMDQFITSLSQASATGMGCGCKQGVRHEG